MFISQKFTEIKNEFNIKKNSHSYIFYTNDFFRCQKDVNSLIKDIFSVNDDSFTESDYFVVKRSDKKNILKEEVHNLKSFFQNTSYISNYRIYLIEEAHKLNSTSANMILKFLEEPSDKIIAFFITDNLDAVLTTIKSRCQIINVFYENNNNNNNLYDTQNEIKEFLYNNNKYFGTIRAKKKFEKYDRNELIELFNGYLNELYNDLLNQDNILLIKKINKVIGMLNNNVNVDYVFDYLFLGSGEDDESS